ncbi:YhdH/YhfP family quinone oxidoreductase [Plebeiibacterium sediminum]|uniref:YhdH/YhfP family quinone oxidoreductase n=1 Tax=Plebeiibacterium sediminum TaxID=2992112 RepID=A0AAE3M5K6_9BACT|nr:YhdH/YhfP family quinone oxidoreductase [Plebeiobacterium sediminum]MCW3787676.1 YhdH/YhfP family quinone oxidoreductase [Plebeiobacterium sediminum]
MKNRSTFKALRVEEVNGNYTTSIKDMPFEPLNKGEVLIKVDYSSLNYKDALSTIGNKGVTKNYPHTPGIDAAGIVESSESELFKAGESVIVTSYELGMNHPGGFAEFIKVPESWIVSMPEKMTATQAMKYGTAGFTAALSVYRLLKNGQKPEMGPVVVSGALGGVGSIACQLLNKLGFKVTAANYELADVSEIRRIGAHSQIDRNVSDDNSNRPMLKTQWAGAIDVVGGNTLTTLLKGCNPLGSVTTCGNIGSGDLNMTVYPFILRGVSLLGIDSQNCPMKIRQIVWDLLADDWSLEFDSDLIKEATLESLKTYIELMLDKKSKGRVIVKL